MFRVIISGDRNYVRANAVNMMLDGLYAQYGEDLYVIHGDAKGADKLADAWCKKKWPNQSFRHMWAVAADWHKYKKSAGPIRNRVMLDEGEPDLVIGFHDNIEVSKGTKDMLQYAEDNGVPHILITKLVRK